MSVVGATSSLAVGAAAQGNPRRAGADSSLEDVFSEIVAAAERRQTRSGSLRTHLARFAGEVGRDGIAHVVLLSMGGSSLGPEVLRQTFGSARGHPELVVLDSTVPARVRSWLLDLTAKALGDDQELESIQAYVEESGEGSLDPTGVDRSLSARPGDRRVTPGQVQIVSGPALRRKAVGRNAQPVRRPCGEEGRVRTADHLNLHHRRLWHRGQK